MLTEPVEVRIDLAVDVSPPPPPPIPNKPSMPPPRPLVTESTADEIELSPPPRTLEIISAATSALMYFNQMIVGKSDCMRRWCGDRFHQRLKGVERFGVFRRDDHPGGRELDDNVRTANVDRGR